VSNRQGGQQDVYVMNDDGTQVANLTNHDGNDFKPAWSPDGAKIAFYSNRDGNFEIYVMNADGSEQTRLTNTAAQDVVPDWSPDGTKIVRKIAFDSDRDGNFEDLRDERRRNEPDAGHEQPVHRPAGALTAPPVA